uniref:GRAM domain-containing protein n=1 Tax=Monopterus albus TaxID=43700 RepID=A0A3Q3KMX0_MONAL
MITLYRITVSTTFYSFIPLFSFNVWVHCHTSQHLSLSSLQSFQKHNKAFHKLFPDVPKGENLIQSEWSCSVTYLLVLIMEMCPFVTLPLMPSLFPAVAPNALFAKWSAANDELKQFSQRFSRCVSFVTSHCVCVHLFAVAFTCALQKEVLYLGKLFVSERHVCFHSAVLLKDTKLVIPTPSIREVKKNNTALSMLSIQTVDGGKYSLVSLRDREMCSKILQSVCSNSQQGESLNSSALLCSAGNDDVASSLTPLEDSIDHDLSRQSSVNLDNGSHQMFGEGPIRFISTRQSSFTNEDDRGLFCCCWYQDTSG